MNIVEDKDANDNFIRTSKRSNSINFLETWKINWLKKKSKFKQARKRIRQLKNNLRKWYNLLF